MKKILKKLIAKIAILGLLLGLNLVPGTNSYFKGQAIIENNVVSLGCWTAPSAPVLSSPADGTIVNSFVDQTFSWVASSSSCPGANISYQFQAYTDSDLSSLYADSGWVSSTSVILYAIPEGAYYWHVKARDQHGHESAYSSAWLFTVSLAPPASGNVVINEVYYDVAAGDGTCTENKNEWIELYNNKETDVPLKNWSLVDFAGNTKTINPEVSIPAHGFAILSHDNSTWTQCFTPAEGAPTINLTGSTAWLNNTGDKLMLKDPSGNIVDWVAWENFETGWNITADKGESIARKVKGVDTDSPSDWHTLTTPNPGTNPHPDNQDKKDKENLELSLSISSDQKAVSFAVSNIKDFVKLFYELTYDANSVHQAALGDVTLSKQDSFAKDNIILGTCTSGGTCVYHTNIKNLRLKVILENELGAATVLEKTLE